MTCLSTFLRPSRPFVLLLIASTTVLPGCHRQFYRKQADDQVNCLLDEKASHIARPPNTPIRVDVDRRSRMFNPFDVDFQPMPLDDPNSYRYMQCVDGRRGYPMWEAAGLTNAAENPDWWQFLPLDEDGVLVLNAENAVRIALLHSPEYQFQVEQLYIAALAVSAERFAFDTQFFGGYGSTLGISDGSTLLGFGNARTGGRTRVLELNRAFATGGTLVASIANNIVWELSGPNSQSASTLLDFTLLQPLLRNAGRDKVLEELTQSERNLLAAVRSFERFRRSFFLQVTIGRNFESRIALNSVVPTVSGAIGANAGGILGLLQDKLRIRNSEENLARQTELLLILEDQLVELLTTIPDNAQDVIRQRLQVAQTRQQLLTSQTSLVNQQASYQATLDGFLRTLGLPPYICVRIEDPILDQFELIDRTLLNRREQLSALRANVGSINVSILERGEFKLDPDTGLPVAQIQWSPELAESLDILRSELEPLAEFTEDLIENDLPVVKKDVEKLAEALPDRRKRNESLKALYETEQQSICGLLNLSEFDESVFDIGQLDTLVADLNEDFAGLEDRLRKYQMRIQSLAQAFDKLNESTAAAQDPRDLARQLRDEIILASQDLVAELGEDVLALQLIQANARTESVTLPEVDIAPETALEIARKNRRDWANARAALVDSWRAIEVTADDLESTLDVVLSGSVANAGNNPLELRTRTAQLRAGLQWDAPITRILERNAYRTTLIRYEQRKRDFYQFEDGVWQLLRSEIRQLQANGLTFELGREAIRTSAAQIELNTDLRQLQEARGQSQGPTAARDSIQATNDLLRAQNTLLNIYVNYEVVRRGLDFDLGTMELTPEGLWIDPGEFSVDTLMSLPGTTSEGMLECGGCNDCGLIYHPLPPEPTFGNAMLQVGNFEAFSSEAMDMSTAVESVEVPYEEIGEGEIQELPAPGQHLGTGPMPTIAPMPIEGGLTPLP